MSDILRMPLHKKQATAAELLRDVALAAELDPGRFERIILCYSGNDAGVEIVSFGNMRRSEAIGIIEIAKLNIADDLDW
jgi:hypothetical protein